MKKLICAVLAVMCLALTESVKVQTEQASPTEATEQTDNATTASSTPEEATPTEPSTPGEASPSEPNAPSRPGGGGGKKSGGRGGGTKTISPGDALTSSHARGDRTLTAHWGADAQASVSENRLNLDGGDGVIEFVPDDSEGTFTFSIGENEIPVLSAQASGTFIINGLALRAFLENGMEEMEIAFENTRILISTASPASGEEYALLKSMGVGARRLSYVFSIDRDGKSEFSAYLDGEAVALLGTYRTVITEEGED